MLAFGNMYRNAFVHKRDCTNETAQFLCKNGQSLFWKVNAMQPDILDSVSAEISRFVSEKDARAIVARLRREWGGESFYVRRIDRQARDATIRRELAAGRSIHAAAKAAGCSTGAARRAKYFLAL